jgi:PST family polysaccharide transporter
MQAEVYPSPSSANVGRLARVGATWSFVLIVTRQLLSIGTTAVLSRILPPGDFGVVAMVGTVTSFLMLVSDMGLSWATVQTERLEQKQIDTLFWAGAASGGLAWGACAMCAPIVARFYGNAALEPLCWILGMSLLINGLTIQPTALLKRQMRQRELAVSQTAAVLIAGVVSVGMALGGAGYWSLAAQIITAALVLLATSFYWSQYRPARPGLSPGAISLLKFGGYVGACNIMIFFQINMDNILIGRYCGAEELGFYSRAYALRALPAMYATMALTDVIVPALAAIQGDRERLESVFVKAIQLMAIIGCPVAVLLGVTAEESVFIIYGTRWEAVAPLLVLLSFPALVLPLNQMLGCLFVATGKVRQMFLLSASTLPLVGITYYVAVGWGATGIAVAAAALAVPNTFISFYVAHTATGLRLKQTLKAVVPVLLACGCAAVGALTAGWWATILGCQWLIILGAKLFAGAVLYIFMCVYLVRPLPIQRLEQLVQFTGGSLFRSAFCRGSFACANRDQQAKK